MGWTAYEVFSVLSGLLMIGWGAIGDEDAGGRMWLVLGGVGFIGYGIYVANQDSGYYTFPVWIFIFPVLAVVYIAVQVVDKVRSTSSPGAGPFGAGGAQRPTFPPAHLEPPPASSFDSSAMMPSPQMQAMPSPPTPTAPPPPAPTVPTLPPPPAPTPPTPAPTRSDLDDLEITLHDQAVPPTRNCPNCEVALPGEQRFCASCGTRVW